MNPKILKVFLFVLLQFAIFVAPAQEWQPDWESALALSKKENKNILLVFSGSDWCAPCIKLEKTIWTSDLFKTYYPKHFVLYKADFPRKSSNKLEKNKAEKNKTLAEKYNPKGFFPLVLIINADGGIKAETGFKKLEAQDYINHLNELLK